LEENSGSSLFTTVEFEEVARVGEWKLYEAKVTDWNLSSVKSGGSLGSGGMLTSSTATEYGATIVFKLSGSAISGVTSLGSESTYLSVDIDGDDDEISIYVDDIRMQPLTAKMSTYVYDINTFNLLTQFDDQHFGAFYQYNKEGKLIRLLKETERGMKTIKETQYNIPASSR
jgi:hypothetical protein